MSADSLPSSDTECPYSPFIVPEISPGNFEVLMSALLAYPEEAWRQEVDRIFPLQTEVPQRKDAIAFLASAVGNANNAAGVLGLKDYLPEKISISPDQILKFLAASQVNATPILYGGEYYLGEDAVDGFLSFIILKFYKNNSKEQQEGVMETLVYTTQVLNRLAMLLQYDQRVGVEVHITPADVLKFLLQWRFDPTVNPEYNSLVEGDEFPTYLIDEDIRSRIIFEIQLREYAGRLELTTRS